MLDGVNNAVLIAGNSSPLHFLPPLRAVAGRDMMAVPRAGTKCVRIRQLAMPVMAMMGMYRMRM